MLRSNHPPIEYYLVAAWGGSGTRSRACGRGSSSAWRGTAPPSLRKRPAWRSRVKVGRFAAWLVGSGAKLQHKPLVAERHRLGTRVASALPRQEQLQHQQQQLDSRQQSDISTTVLHHNLISRHSHLFEFFFLHICIITA